MGSCASAQKVSLPKSPVLTARVAPCFNEAFSKPPKFETLSKPKFQDESFLENMVRRHQESGINGQTSEAKTSAFLHNLESLSDDKLLEHWSEQHEILPEYRKAADCISVNHEWMSNTKTLRHARNIGKRSKDTRSIDAILDQVIMRAYGNQTNSRSQKDVVSNQLVFENVKKCYNSLEQWKKPLFIQAWVVILELESDKGAIVSKLSEVVDRALHCPQVQVQSFQLVLSHAARLVDKRDASVHDTMDQYSAALHQFYACFEDFLDDYKEKAFGSAFMEPARFYLTHSGIGPGFLRDNVDTHANNWYIALLNATLSVHVPLMATYWDDFPPVTCDYWDGLKEEAWQHFSNPENFGRQWQGIPAMKRDPSSMIAKRVSTGFLPDAAADSRHTSSALGASFNQNLKTAKFFANRAVGTKEHGGASVKEKQALALYLERFASFFEQGRFVRRAFETLNSEVKPEHQGFRSAFQILFAAYRVENGLLEESYVEYCYSDDMYTELDLERTAKLFLWLGVLKPQSEIAAGAKLAAENQSSATICKVRVNLKPAAQEECPICCEICTDVQTLVHEHHPKRDVSSHRACAKCREQMVARNQSCPWCRDNMVWQELFGFLDGLKSNMKKAQQPDELADLMGTWQEYELTRPLVDVRRFASDMVEDVALSAHLDRVLRDNNVAFMRDSAGIWCRFHAMVVDREIHVSTDASNRLKQLVEGAMKAFEKDGGNAPQHVGAMYTQLASAVLCARFSGSSLTTLVQLTQQVGHTSVRLHRQRFKNAAGVRERLPKVFAESVSDPVWGSAQQDVVLKEFF